MLEVSSIEDIKALRESTDVECKLAQGRDGKGKLPNDFWETYSAFANTQGGDVFLGLKEKKNQSFDLAGIENTQKVIDELWTGLNNLQKVSGNILRDRWVNVLTIEGKDIIQIHVPQAPRKQKPVFIKGNPLKGTYKRLNSADLLQNEEEVRRMLAEQVEESRDSEILKGYGIGDLELDSFNAYRRLYITRQPDHPWNQNDAQDFLYNIGGWARDREAGYSGLTRAGLLMFGRLRAIKEAFPNYMLDYQERDEARTEARWIDRFTLDGTWSGNIFDFYRQIIRKLTADLKVPFQMEGDQRLDDTLVHKALREALVNALVHADYTGRASILVVKRPDMFGFRNPGLMRIPLDTAIAGGESDCRNRLLQDMFRFVGLGENAGSGLPKIYQGWSSQHWRDPALREKLEPSEQTLLELHMLSLVPDEVLAELRLSLGSDVFDSLSENERLILVTAQIETTVDHQRMMTVMDVHPRDLTILFSGLVEKGIIYQEGAGRGTIYFLSEARNNDMVDLLFDDISGGQGASSGGLGVSSGGLKESSGGLKVLEAIAEVVASRKKSPKLVVEKTILSLCKLQELTLDELADLLNRSNESIRKDYLQPMIKDKRLRYRYPTLPNHPDQAYATNDSEEKG
jgi:predicted HTH transcriptional regulator